MKAVYIALFCIISNNIFSQTLSGIITNEDQVPLPGVVVINMSTKEKVLTNYEGKFSILASANSELRFVRNGYERLSKVIDRADLLGSIQVSLLKQAQEIEEVEIKEKLSGNLKADNKKLGPPEREAVLTNTLSKYKRQKSDPSIMQAKRNEFVQPKGEGFETTKIGYKWETFDLFLYLEKTLGDDYFISLGLTRPQIQPFIFFALQDFEKNKILRFGYCSDGDLGRFQIHAEDQIKKFNNWK